MKAFGETALPKKVAENQNPILQLRRNSITSTLKFIQVTTYLSPTSIGSNLNHNSAPLPRARKEPSNSSCLLSLTSTLVIPSRSHIRRTSPKSCINPTIYAHAASLRFSSSSSETKPTARMRFPNVLASSSLPFCRYTLNDLIVLLSIEKWSYLPIYLLTCNLSLTPEMIRLFRGLYLHFFRIFSTCMHTQPE